MAHFLQENAYVLGADGKPSRRGGPFPSAALVAINPEDIAHVHQVYIETPEVGEREGPRIDVTMKDGTVYRIDASFSFFMCDVENALREHKRR